jgi:hypothetical protein
MLARLLFWLSAPVRWRRRRRTYPAPAALGVNQRR